MCFMAATPTDCAEISFHTWTSLSAVCVSIHSVVSALTLHFCSPWATSHSEGREWDRQINENVGEKVVQETIENEKEERGLFPHTFFMLNSILNHN